MNTKIKFTDDIALEQLNPFNYALKNDYMSNLITTGALILPPLQARIALPLIVKKALVNKNIAMSYSRSKHKIERDLVDSFTKGLALEITWDGFSPITAMEAVQGVMASTDEKIIVIMNTEDNYISFYRGTGKREIIEISTGIGEASDNARIIKN